MVSVTTNRRHRYTRLLGDITNSYGMGPFGHWFFCLAKKLVIVTGYIIARKTENVKRLYLNKSDKCAFTGSTLVGIN